MIAFLTSNPGDTYIEDGARKSRPSRFSAENGFLERLTAVWPAEARCLLICAEPDNGEMNDGMRDNFLASFALSGLPVSRLEVCDGRTAHRLPELLAESDVVILSGGHTLTQNRFFHRLDLKRLIRDFDGVILAISGGSMNCGEVVYAQPEWPGDTTDPTYDRFPEGLGLTPVMILPHYQVLRDQTLDGLRLIEDVALPDSMGRTIHALPDGSYVLVENGESRIMGEAYVIRDGRITRI